MYRKKAYIVGRIAGFFVVLLMAIVVAIQTPSVQTKITSKVAQSLEQSFGALIKYDKLSIMPSGALLIENAVIIDQDPCTLDPHNRGFAPVDTLFCADRITATFTLSTLMGENGLRLGRVNVEGGFFHLCIENTVDTLTNVQSIFRLEKSDGIMPEPGPTIFRINHVKIKDFRYRMTDRTEIAEEVPAGIDYSDMDVAIEKLRGHSLKYSGSRMYGYLDQLKLTEKSGYKMENLRANCIVGQGKALIENIHLRDSWSDVKIDFFSMGFNSSKDFKYFETKILMEGRIKGGDLGLTTLHYFAGEPSFKNDLTLSLKGGPYLGYVNDFKVSDLRFTEKKSGISSRINASFVGLPDYEKMLINAKISDTRFSTSGLQIALNEILGSKAPKLTGYADKARFNLNLGVKGPLDRLTLSTQLGSNIGSLNLTSDIRNLITPSRGRQIGFDLSTDKLNIGSILAINDLGESSIYTRGDLNIGKDRTAITLDTLSIESIEALGNRFKGISARGSFADGTVKADISSSDSKAHGTLGIEVSLGEEGDIRKLLSEGSFSNIDLSALGIDKREGRSNAAFDIDSQFNIKGTRAQGHIFLNNIKLQDSEEVKDIGNLHLTAYQLGELQCFNLESSFLDAFLSGSGNLRDFLSEIQDITTRRDLPALHPKDNHIDDQITEKYMLRVLTGDSRKLLSFIMPGLYIADSTRVNISTDTDGSLKGTLNSSRLAYGSNYLRDVKISFDNLDRSLIAEMQAQELMAAGMDLSNPTVTAFADDNAFKLEARVASNTDAQKKAVLDIDGKIYRDSLDRLNITASPSRTYLATSLGKWQFNDNSVHLSDGKIHIDSISINNGAQSILLNGALSADSKDTLSVRFNDMDLAIIDQFTANPFYISGLTNGNIEIISEAKQTQAMLADLNISKLKIGDTDGGTLRIASIMKEDSEDISIYVRNKIGDRNALSINGSFFTNDGHLDIYASLDKLPLAFAKPFTSNLFTDLGGGISGNLYISGEHDDLSISSQSLMLDDAQMTLAFTSVPYTISGPLTLEHNTIRFDSIAINDNDGGTGSILGSLHLGNLRNLSLDTQISINNLKLLDKAQNGGDLYGMVRARGQAHVSGPLNELNVNANIETSSSGNLHVVASQYATGTTSDILTFTAVEKPEDPYEEMLGLMKAKEKAKNDLSVRASVTLHPTLMTYIEIDKEAGNVVSFNGEGTASVFIRPSKDIFEINGDYRISEGNYNFIIPGILSRGFEIQDGSTIRFGGKIPDTQLDINALYKVRASLSNLVVSATDVDTWRMVECGINITDRLSNPRLDFSIDVPDLDPTTKSQIETALATEDKVQKQFLSLLLLGSFLPDETSGVVNGSNILLSNMTELMSSQLNNILSKLDIPLDVGFDYQNATSGNDMFDMAISTQLFNNRVIVGGSVGNRNYSTSTNPRGDVVGDLDVQIKLDPEGKYRLNLFSHSADEYSSFLDFSQRNGVGVSFQKEYHTFGELIGSIFKKGNKADREEEVSSSDKEQVIIKIQNEQRQAIPDTLSAR